MNGAAGGPRMVITPGPEGIASPTRTSGWPLIRTWLGVSGPIGNVYGTPETELIIMQTEPGMASGIPFAVGPPGGMTVIVPVSGGPAIPGETTTEHPILTGGPGIFFFRHNEAQRHEQNFLCFLCLFAALCRREISLACEFDHGALHSG